MKNRWAQSRKAEQQIWWMFSNTLNRLTAKGLVFMDTPGYDPVSATGQVAGGANLICFTTGRGSVYGCKPAPSLKLATNSRLYRQMADDMDINCGEILDGDASIQELGATHLSADFGNRFGSTIPFGGSRVRRRRVRALDAWSRHVTAYGRILHHKFH